MALATLGGYALPVDPDSVAWTFRLKSAEIETLASKVIQIFGTDLGDMSVAGSFGAGGWQARDRFAAQIEKWALADANSKRPNPLRFQMPSKGWDFRVHVKAYSADGAEFEHSNMNFAPRYGLVLFIVEDSTSRVVSGIQDLYISRLMNGIGWKQTEYNGPTQAAVDGLLSPYSGSVADYLRQGFITAAEGGGSSG